MRPYAGKQDRQTNKQTCFPRRLGWGWEQERSGRSRMEEEGAERDNWNLGASPRQTGNLVQWKLAATYEGQDPES